MTLKEFIALPDNTPLYSSGDVWFKMGERSAIDLNGFEAVRLPPPKFLELSPTVSPVPKQAHFAQYMTQGELQVYHGGIEWKVVGAFLTTCWIKRASQIKSVPYHSVEVSNFTKGKPTYWMPWKHDIKEMWNNLKSK